ncbi:MAG: M42 family metallopeptidase [Candidatus Sulfotelmatobacter sp.]
MPRLIAIFILLCISASAQDRVVDLLKELSEAPGVPGYEEPVRKLMTERMKPFADNIVYDGLGSVIAQQGKSGPRIMVDAHMDELGGMVRHIRPDGYLTMQMLGYWLDQALVDQRWIVIGSKGPVTGITALWDAHIAPHADGHQVPEHQMYIDVGARNAADAQALGLSPGDPVVPVSPFVMLANQRYLGKAWDDRVGCAVILEAMRRLQHEAHPNQISYAATVQEEGSIEMRGAMTSAHIIDPDIGIALEVGIPNDLPGTDPDASQETLGGGPGVMLYTFSELPNRKLVDFLKQTAAEKHIPLQFDFVPGFGDDAGAIKLNKTGVPVTTLLVPARYTHTHNGIIDRADFDRTVDLLVTLLQKLDKATVARIKSFEP